MPGYQLDRRCGSGLQAVIDAAMMVQTGVADVVIAGGVESMSNAEYYTNDMRKGARMGSVTLHDRLARGRVMSQPIERFGVISGMIETADNLARDYQISREAADEYAAESHKRAAAAWAAGKFDDEVVPVSRAAEEGRPDRLRHATRASAPTPPPRAWASCAPSRRTAWSPPATPASRTTPPPPAWWSPRTSSPSWAWSRWAGS